MSVKFRNLACFIDTTTKFLVSLNQKINKTLWQVWQLKAASHTFLPTLCALAPPITAEGATGICEFLQHL